MYQRGLQVLETMRQLSEIRETADLRRGALEVGIPPMINLLFTPVVKRFRERHPDIHLTLREGTGQAVENLVADGELEVGATVLPVAPDHGLAARPSAAIRSGSSARRTPPGRARHPCR